MRQKTTALAASLVSRRPLRFPLAILGCLLSLSALVLKQARRLLAKQKR